MSDEVRTRFEAWYRNGNGAESVPMPRHDDGEYMDERLNVQWRAFLAGARSQRWADSPQWERMATLHWYAKLSFHEGPGPL